jgi:hypothetical protein
MADGNGTGPEVTNDPHHLLAFMLLSPGVRQAGSGPRRVRRGELFYTDLKRRVVSRSDTERAFPKAPPGPNVKMQKAQVVAMPPLILTSDLPIVAQSMSFFSRVWPVAGLAAVMIVNFAWMGFLGYGVFKLIKQAFFDWAAMNRYRLFVFDENGRLIGPAVVVRATNEDEAVAQAEAIRRGLAAELLDFNRLRIVARFPDKSVQNRPLGRISNATP